MTINSQIMKQIPLILLSFILPEFLHSQEIQSEHNITTTLNVIEASNQRLDTSNHEFPLFYTLTKFHADVKKLSDEELIRNADIFIQGEVVKTRSYFEGIRIMSEISFKSKQDKIYQIKIDGGIIGDVGAFNSGEIYLNTGEIGSFYLKKDIKGNWVPAFGSQSFIPEIEVQSLIKSNSNANLNTDWANGNADEWITITGDGFGDSQGNGYVTFDNGNGYYAQSIAQSFDYSTWGDEGITVKVPAAFSNKVKIRTDSGYEIETNDSLHIGYNLDDNVSSIYGHTYLHNQEDGGHKFYLNTELHNIFERKAAVERTLNDFVCKTGINFFLSEQGTTLGWNLGDGQNTISFDSASNMLSAGTVGFCNTLWSSCIYNGETFYYVNEMDIVINSSFEYDYSTGNPSAGLAKFSYVLMHELGHAMRLGHVNELGETMYPSVTDMPSNSWYERDTISINDQLGVSHAFDLAANFSFSACGLSNMTPKIVNSGCVNELACNYDSSATCDDGSCVFSELNYDCSGYCINDFDEDGECDEVDYDDGLGVDEVMSSSIKPIRMIDVLGREHKNHQPGMLLFYIYDDGRVQKKYLSR
jgi:hypothetical protein